MRTYVRMSVNRSDTACVWRPRFPGRGAHATPQHDRCFLYMRAVGPLVALLVAVLAAAVPDAQAARSTSLRCPPRHAHVLVSTRQTSVYWFPELGHELPRQEEASEVKACARGHHPVPVEGLLQYGDNAGPCTQGCLRENWRETIALAGPILAYATDSGEDTKYGSCECRQRHIVVRNLRTGRLPHWVPTGPRPGNAPGSYVGLGPAVRVVVKADGAVAWTVRNDFLWEEAFRAGRDEMSFYEVRAIDHGKERLLASGPDLQPRSLALRGSRLAWVQGGKRSYASLQ